MLDFAEPTISEQSVTKLGAPRTMYMVDMFAGCGGLSLGFENAKFVPVFVNELNTDAMASYLKNRQHKLGGLHFSANEALRCNDANDLQGERLEQLVSDLSSLPELGLNFETSISQSAGAGSNIDVLAGGPPCQGYSGIGIRRSYDVDKTAQPSNHLFVRMAHVIRRLRPRIFLFENVRGLLNANWTKGGTEKIFPDVLAEFRSIEGYEVRFSLVKSKDYGVPQNRPRVLLVGIRKDILSDNEFLDSTADEDDAVKCGFLPQPTGNYPDLVDLLGDLVDSKVLSKFETGDYNSGAFATSKYPKAPQNELQQKFRTPPSWFHLKTVPLTEHEYSKHSPNVVAKFKHMIANSGEIPEQFRTKKFSQRVLPERWGNKEPNMTATSLADDYVHFSQPRTLTVREWARLQLFPDWYQFAGKRTTGGLRRAGNPREGLYDREAPKYTQIGNAVPVGLAEAVGCHFRKIIESST
ncbi:DNA cytosine methyltransferase [Maritalea porphyrae]|uniref:DNA cytosine methyltransferase n=1 Tax=Maritalea porphyrae TaxID=880732 RepID=UPI0022AED621|nr:DNA (cytosine-5-)-methyltransferase [Maritalea porphyrae]MCZ4273369.1 DNA (cytosine-5-)-methyltransferase [Maritalea porphyrae]